MSAAFSSPAGKDILGHPRGLWYLVVAEACERFSYYGMQALLVLYLTKYLLQAEHLTRVAGFGAFQSLLEGVNGPLATPVATATAITGLYSAGVYFTPMIGGYLADRWLGRTNTVTLGALFMVAGHFLMAFDVAFVAAILCLFVGVGMFKGNIAAQVGELYGPGDLRRSTAFQAFLLGVQVSAIGGPIVTGFLGEKVAWHYGFGAAGVGMAIAMVVYRWGRRYLPPEPARGTRARSAPTQKFTGREWATMAVLIALLPVLAAASLANQQIFNAYLLWSDANYDLVFFGTTMPTSWLVSLDASISTATMGAALLFWTVYAKYRKEPNEIVKLAIGAAIAASAPMLLALAGSHAAATGEKVSLVWGLGFHIVNDVGIAMVFPIGLALFSRAAPRRVGGLFVGIYYLNFFMANLAAGKLGGFIESMDGYSFWAMHAAIVGGGAVALIVFAVLFGRLLAPEGDPTGPAPAAAARLAKAA